MGEILLTTGFDVFASDIAPLSRSVFCLDFFAPGDGLMPNLKHIVTNPPYSLATSDFIRHAIDLTEKTGGKVAMFLRNEFDCAVTRRNLFQKCPTFDTKLVMTKRPKWNDHDIASPRHNYAWFIWDWSRQPGPARIIWDQ